MQNTFYVPIFIFSTFILILFIYLLTLTVIQFMNYVLTTGFAECNSVDGKSSCKLTFDYRTSGGDVKEATKLISYDEIGQSGKFTVDVAYKLNEDDKIDNFYVVGSNTKPFLGTQNNVIIYSILSFLSLILMMSLIPFSKLRLSKKTKK